MTCPSCGAVVRVHAADEGTCSYVPLGPCPGPERCGTCGAEPVPQTGIAAELRGALLTCSSVRGWHTRHLIALHLEPAVCDLVRAGQERMRERAGAEADRTLLTPDPTVWKERPSALLGSHIRALPLEEAE